MMMMMMMMMNIFTVYTGTITPLKYSPQNAHFNIAYDLAFGGRFAMALYRYYQPVCGDNLPDPKGPLSTTIPRQAIAEANKQVPSLAFGL